MFLCSSDHHGITIGVSEDTLELLHTPQTPDAALSPVTPRKHHVKFRASVGALPSSWINLFLCLEMVFLI